MFNIRNLFKKDDAANPGGVAQQHDASADPAFNGQNAAAAAGGAAAGRAGEPQNNGEAGSEALLAVQSESGGAEQSSGSNNFFSGTSKFFDSVQAKKNGLMSDLSSKIGQFKPFGEEGVMSGLGDRMSQLSSAATGGGATGKTGKTGKKQKRPKSAGGVGAGDSGEGDSSASEYGDDGDKPEYTDATPDGRRASLGSIDSLPETEANQYRQFIVDLVNDLFRANVPISENRKATFRSYCSHHTGRSMFAKTIQNEKAISKKVEDSIRTNLEEFFAVALNECHKTDDFRPGRALMKYSFMFYTENVSCDGRCLQQYVFMRDIIKSQPLWQSMRFWNAAFFEALQEERANAGAHSNAAAAPANLDTEDSDDSMSKEKVIQDEIAFALISKFTWNMRALGHSKETCVDFLRKQAPVVNLSREKINIIRANIERYSDTSEPAIN